MGFCVNVTKETTSSKDSFKSNKIIPHAFILCLYITVCIFSLHVKNKPHEGVYKCAFILGSVSMDANNIYIYVYVPVLLSFHA